jgi:hypothetical protein
MTDTSPDDDHETASFKIADQKITSLLKRLSDRDLCPRCTARALAYHAACLAECVMGSGRSDRDVRGHPRDHARARRPRARPSPFNASALRRHGKT